MKKYKIKSVPTKRGAFIRGRIDKSRRRAETVGMLYLVALIALVAATCLGLLTSEYASVDVQGAVATVMARDFGTVSAKIKFGTAVLYLLSLLVSAICVLNALTHLKNLFKKKVSRVYGLNANIDAMDSIGRMFSVGFASIPKTIPKANDKKYIIRRNVFSSMVRFKEILNSFKNENLPIVNSMSKTFQL